MTTAFCSACLRVEPVDSEWRALWIDADGDLRLSAPGRAFAPELDRDSTVFVCGQGSALVLVERYLHSHNFLSAHETAMSLAEAACASPDFYPELT